MSYHQNPNSATLNYSDTRFWAKLLTKSDIENLTGYMDTLIEMDFEIKRKQRLKRIVASVN